MPRKTLSLPILTAVSAAFSQSPVTALLIQGNTLDMSALPGFPLRTVIESRTGQNLTKTVMSISDKPIADSEFDIPADYKQEKENGK